MSNRAFQTVGGLRPSRSIFDLSYSKKLTCDMAQLIPVMCDEMVPGDKFIVGNEVVARTQALLAPMMHEVNIFVHYFFVPYRLIWDDWEDFITGGATGELAPSLPRWNPGSTANCGIGSLWDYLGFPTDILPAGAYPLDFPRRAYNRIFNEYYRDQTLMDPISEDNTGIQLRCWTKDYFTSALPWQQRGTAPALPISGSSSAVFNGGTAYLGINAGQDTSHTVLGNVVSNAISLHTTGGDVTNAPLSAVLNSAFKSWLNQNTVTFSNLGSFDVADLRVIFQVQKWLERNARSGGRYTEQLRAHFGVSPRDDRLQRPEYVGGSKSPLIVSEVLQTSSSTDDSPQGNMAGHAIGADRQFVAKYFAQEFGLMMGIMSVMPVPAYQDGINRQWLRKTKYDFYFPEFAHLSEQPIELAEVWASGVEADNTSIFGYQGRYNEMRYKADQVCGLFRTTLDYWHLGRKFPTKPALNHTFVKCEPSKRVFAVTDEPCLLINFGNVIKAIRPLPIEATPGLTDHF